LTNTTGGAAGGRDNASRQVAMSTPSYTRLTLLLDKKQRLEACKKQIKELKAKMSEQKNALERNMKATIAAPKEGDSEAEIQRYASCQKVEIVTAAAPDGQDCAGLWREQLDSDRMKACCDRLDISAEYQ
jgi:hypothetical protein